MWQKPFGGTQYENGFFISQTFDKGFVLASSSFSNDGDVTGHHGTTSYSDSWVVKLDSVGNISWEKSLGGANNDEARCVIQASDGGYIVASSAK